MIYTSSSFSGSAPYQKISMDNNGHSGFTPQFVPVESIYGLFDLTITTAELLFQVLMIPRESARRRP